jgi:hypothetical protein
MLSPLAAMKMNSLNNSFEDIRDIFSVLHDGGVVSWANNEDALTLKVECEYLAERIDRTFQSFTIKLDDVQMLEFEPWVADASLSQSIFTNIDEIFQGELILSSATIEEESVRIYCVQRYSKFGYSGGELRLSAKAIALFDHAGKPLSVDDILQIGKQYWEEWSNQANNR